MDRVQVMAAVGCFLAAGLPASPCAAQAPATATPASPQAPAKPTIDQYAAGLLVRLSLVDLRAIDDPQPRDYAVTLALLDAAQTLAPTDLEIARRRSEAAWNAADQDGLLASTKTVVDLDPRDTVAQLRLLTTRIGRMQTTDERLAAYDRALGPTGASLDESVRSRLALDAALLKKERGDQEGYIRYLKQAAQLDPTNKEAALLALDLYTQRVGDPMGRLELLSNLLMADPMDPRVLLELRDVMASGGAYKAATRFHEMARKVLAASGTTDDVEMDLSALVLNWRVNGARPALVMLLEQLQSARRDVAIAAQASEKGGLSYRKRPEDMRLAMPFEEARLGTSLQLANEAEVYRSFTDLNASMQAQVDVLKDRGRRPSDMTDEQAQERTRLFARHMAYWHAFLAAVLPGGLVPPPPPDAKAAAEQGPAPIPAPTPAQNAAPPGPGPTPPVMALADGPEPEPILDGWRAIEAGDFAKAKERLDAAEDQDDPWAALGRAVVFEKTGALADAAREYQRLSSKNSMRVVGAIASAREADLAIKLGAAAPKPELDASKLEEFAKSVPSWVDTLVERPWNFQSLRVEAMTPRVTVQDRVQVRVKLRNLSPIPLALGTGLPINTRLLFIASMEAGGNVQAPGGEVVEVNRRLRLLPGQELEFIASPEVGLAGYAAEKASMFPTRISWRVIQGFETQQDGSTFPGPGCVDVHSDSVLHEPLPEARLSADELIAKITSADLAQLPGLLVAARMFVLKDDAIGISRLSDAIVARYPQWPPVARMMVLAALPPSSRVPLLKPLDEKAAKDTDPKVLMVAAIARPQGPDDPILVAAGAAAVAANDMTLARVVSAQQERMRDGTKTYSQVGMPDKSLAPVPPAATPAPAARPISDNPVKTTPPAPGAPAAPVPPPKQP
jgi:tetratricopeptide (TPR) repeat protein